ncbi:hypothetical protein GQ53DRAFT_832161 [Thozetella sp. PMI_491]|nr:hypothetical protein GQ53DRAFT_832161 [Thozetella sp. PMI_491]
MPYLQPSTWRLLGLSVGMGYVFFGTFEIVYPAKAGKEILDIPKKPSPEASEMVSLLAPLMGARDLSIAAAIFTFYAFGQGREMGVVIVAGTVLCVADAVAIGIYKGLAP